MSQINLLKTFVIGARDARLEIGSLKKAKDAQPAVKAVKAVKAKPEIRDANTGEITQEGVEAVAAVKAKPAVPAQPAEQKVRLVASAGPDSRKVAEQIVARMRDQGFEPHGEITEKENGEHQVIYVDESDKPIRAAFKACKAKDNYNKAGLELRKKAAAKEAAEKKKAAEEKAAKEKAEAEAKAKKEAEGKGEDWPPV